MDSRNTTGENWNWAIDLFEDCTRLRCENRELREKLTKFEEDGAKGKGYSGSSGMVHRIDVLKQQLRAMTADRNLWQDEHNGDCPNLAALTAANTRIAELTEQAREAERIIREVLEATAQEICDDDCCPENCPWSQARGFLVSITPPTPSSALELETK